MLVVPREALPFGRDQDIRGDRFWPCAESGRVELAPQVRDEGVAGTESGWDSVRERWSPKWEMCDFEFSNCS